MKKTSFYSKLYSLPKMSAFKTQISKAYAKWYIRPTQEESRSYNHTDRILLSFDDYADDKNIQLLLEILEVHKTKAVFFLIGEWAESHQALMKDIKERGHWIGNHTYSHQRLTKLSFAEATLEISRGVSGNLLRPPYGAYNERIRALAKTLGYRIAFWTIDSDDWRGLTSEQIQERVWSQLHKGACILLHLNGQNTLESIPHLIEGIRKRGFEMCTDGTEIT